MRRLLRSNKFTIVFPFAIVFIATLFSGAFMHQDSLIPLFNPVIGVSFGFLLINGRKIYPSVLSAFFLAHVVLTLYTHPSETSFTLISAFGFSGILFLELELGLLLMNTFNAPVMKTKMHIKDVFYFFLAGGVMSFLATLLASGIYYFFQANALSLADIMITVFFSHFLSIGVLGLLTCLNNDLTEKELDWNKFLSAFLFLLVFFLAIIYMLNDSSSFIFYRHNYMLVIFYMLASVLFTFFTVLLMTIILYMISVFVYLDASWVLADFYAEVYTLLALGLVSVLLSFIITRYLEDEHKASQELKTINDSLNMTLEYIQNLLQLSKNIGNFTSDNDVFVKNTYDLIKSIFTNAGAHFAYFDDSGVLETKYSSHYSIKNIPGFYEFHDTVVFNSENVVLYSDPSHTLKSKYGTVFLRKHPRLAEIKTRVYLIMRIKEKKHLIIGLDYFNNDPSPNKNTIDRMEDITRILNQLFLKNTLVEQQSSLKDDIILTLVRTLDLYDKYTKGHGEVVARISKAIAEELRLSEKEINDVYLAGLLHDIGKLGVDHSVLNSGKKLSDAEYNTIKSHVDYGYQLLQEASSLSNVARMMREHHERIDGLGYPLGLNKDSITLGGKILAVADAVATMASNRPYQMRKNFKAIIKELNTHKNLQFDPKVSDACIALIESGRLDPSE